MKIRMRTLLVVACTRAFVGMCYGQNSVLNPGFEGHDDCTFGVEWANVHDWQIPVCVSEPGCRNSCNNVIDPGIGVPCNLQGCQPAHGGEGYLLLGAYYRYFSAQQKKVSAHLVEPLVANETYCVRFWLSLADSSEARCNLLHGLFSVDPPSACNGGDSTWAQQAQVTYNTSSVGSEAWHMLEAQYVAQGGEEYFTFGNFRPDSLTDVTYLGPMYVHSRSMFYVDDVAIEHCDVRVNELEEPALADLRVWPNPSTAGEAVQVNYGRVDCTVYWTLEDALGRMKDQGIGSVNSLGVIQIQTREGMRGTFILRVRSANDAERVYPIAVN
jgi:hypothetical protein